MAASLALLLMCGPSAAVPGEPDRAAMRRPAAGASLLGNFSLAGPQGPISVDADALELSYRDRVLTYSGNVTVTQGDLRLRSETLTVTLSDDREDPVEQVVAEGNVRINKGERQASGGKAVFNQKTRTVQLSHDAVLLDGPNRISGERVVVYLDEERSVVEGGERRVQAVLYPDAHAPAQDPAAAAPRREEGAAGHD